MALSTILVLVSPALALPVIHDDHRRRASGTDGQNGGNSASPKIIVPVVLAAVVLLMLLVTAWWRRRKRLRQVVTDIRNNASTTNASTPAATRAQSNNRTQQSNTRTPITAPGTGPDAPPRPPRRRRRRRPSQISTKSLPAYNEQAGDEEIVLVRRVERDSMSDEDDDDDDNDNDDNPRNSRMSGREHSRSASETPLLEDASPEMGRISLASSTRGRSEGGHDEEQSPDTDQHTRADTTNDTSISLATAADTTNDSLAPLPEVQETITTNVPLDDAPPYTEAERPSQDGSGLENSQSSDAGAGPSTSANTAEADALGTLRPKRKSVFRQFFALNRPGSTSTALSDAVEMAPTEPRQSLSAASATTTTTTATTQGGAQTRHRPSASISTLASSSRGHTLSPSLSSLLLTRSRSPTRSSDSLAQRYNISAPIPTTLIRTELSYPRSGPTPEQIRFLSSRESLGRFGMPYGEEAVAAAALSRENISSMISPPQYELGASTNATSETQNSTVTPNSRRAGLGSSTLSQAPTIAVTSAEPSESELASTETESAPRPGSPQTGMVEQNTATHDARSMSGAAADQPERPDGSAMPANDRRDSVFSTNSFVTATEGDRETVAEGRGEDDDGNDSDSAPPTPTVDTYRLADEDTTMRVPENTEHQADAVRQPTRGQTILIPGSQTGDDAHHPQLTFIPATPTVDAPAHAT